MLLIPLIRSSRAVSACLIYPEHPIQAIAVSEFVSVIGPMLNPQILTKVIGTIYALAFNPSFAHYYIKTYHDRNTIHNQAEICTTLLFIATMIAYNYL